MDLETLKSIVKPEILRIKDHENEASQRPHNVFVDKSDAAQSKPKYLEVNQSPELSIQRVAPVVISGPEYRGSLAVPEETFRNKNDDFTAPDRRATGFFQS